MKLILFQHFIKLIQTNEYDKCFDNNNRYINPLVLDEELLKKYNELWGKIKS